MSTHDRTAPDHLSPAPSATAPSVEPGPDSLPSTALNLGDLTPFDPQLDAGSVAVVFGTRPEIIKLAGIVNLLGAQARTIYSGQHFDDALSRVFFDELQLRPPDSVLSVGGRSRARQMSELLAGLEREFTIRVPRAVVVQGDTNTAAGGALAANALGIPLVHVEAGLRSFDRRMPEEHNRVIADHLSDLCLAPTEQARQNLLAESISEARVVVTGNTVIDAAAQLIPAASERRDLLQQKGLTPGSFILATFHRPENVDDTERLTELMDTLGRLELPVLFPVHPRTRQRLLAQGRISVNPRVEMVPPMGYRTFLAFAAECAVLLSDSGGVQEEASVVKRPAVVVRRSTERPEVIGTFAFLVPELSDVPAVVSDLCNRLGEVHRRLADTPSPFGDGHASERCVRHLLTRIKSSF